MPDSNLKLSPVQEARNNLYERCAHLEVANSLVQFLQASSEQQAG